MMCGARESQIASGIDRRGIKAGSKEQGSREAKAENDEGRNKSRRM